MTLRRFIAAVGVLGWSVVAAPGAAAQVAPPLGPPPTSTCSASLAGQPVEQHRTAGRAIHVRYNEVIRVEGRASAAVSSVKYRLMVAGRSFALGESFVTEGNTWSGEVRIDEYAWAGVGLYEVVGVAETAAGQCRDRVFVCVNGKSPFTTAAGLAATAGGLIGLVMLLRSRGRNASVAPRAIGGGLTAFGAVVLMQQACIRPLSAGMVAIIPIGAVIAVVIGLIFGRGTPVVMSSQPPPAPVAKEQPRTESRDIYQFRAPSNACNACRQHALNKVFASAEAMRRAHPGCHCSIDWRPVDQASWNAYFRTGTEYDPRRARP